MSRLARSTVIQAGDVTVFSCDRRPVESCSSCGARADRRCDYPVIRGGEDTVCGRLLCDRCATVAGPDSHHCPPHQRLVAASAPEPIGSVLQRVVPKENG